MVATIIPTCAPPVEPLTRTVAPEPGTVDVMPPSGSSARPGSRALRLHTWSDGAVVAVALAALASGFGQFGAVAALGDVAREFGRVTHGATIADQAGLSGTQLGVGLAIIRLASLGSLPLVGLADRFGRRTMLIATLSIGLALTVAAAAAFGYWSFVVIFACGRPLLSATNALTQVAAAEQTSSRAERRRSPSPPPATESGPGSSPSSTVWPRVPSASAASVRWLHCPWPPCRFSPSGFRNRTASRSPRWPRSARSLCSGRSVPGFAGACS